MLDLMADQVLQHRVDRAESLELREHQPDHMPDLLVRIDSRPPDGRRTYPIGA